MTLAALSKSDGIITYTKLCETKQSYKFLIIHSTLDKWNPG